METISENSVRDRVYDVCNGLHSRSEKISVRIVLGLLGGDVTSTSTVHKHYKAWREELVATQRDLLERVGFSQEFTRAFMTEISRHATESESRYKGIADDALDQSAAAIDDLRAIEDRLSKQSSLLAVTQKDLSDLKAASSATIKALEDRLSVQDKAYKERLNDGKEAINNLQSIIERQTVQLATAKVYEAQNQQLTLELKEMAGQLLHSSTELSAVTEKVESRSQTIHDREMRIDEYKDQLQLLQKEMYLVQQERDQLIGQLNVHKDDTAALKKQFSEIEIKLTEANTQILNLNQVITEKNAIIKDLEVGQDPKKE